MSKRLLFCTGEGIGNTIQCIPVVRTLVEVLGYDVDVWHAFGSYNTPKIIPYCDKWIVGNQIQQINPNNYKGLVSTFWTRDYAKHMFLKLLSRIYALSMSRSEVDTYMQIARDLGVEEKDLIWHGECLYSNTNNNDKYDVVIHDGYNRYGSADWSVKSYSRYSEVALKLKEAGFRVCSVGNEREYIEDTDNMTGFDLLTTFGMIKKCKLFLGNDSGLYHAANALNVRNIVIFTATSIEKNFDSRFHKYSTIMGRDDLECRPCQAGRGWKNCKTWECRNIDPQIIYEKAMEMLNGNNRDS